MKVFVFFEPRVPKLDIVCFAFFRSFFFSCRWEFFCEIWVIWLFFYNKNNSACQHFFFQWENVILKKKKTTACCPPKMTQNESKTGSLYFLQEDFKTLFWALICFSNKKTTALVECNFWEVGFHPVAGRLLQRNSFGNILFTKRPLWWWVSVFFCEFRNKLATRRNR